MFRFSRYPAGQSDGGKEPGDTWRWLWMAGRDPDTLKKYGKGDVVYLMPGHAATDFENDNISQMILNAIIWEPDE